MDYFITPINQQEDRWVKILGEKCESGCGENRNEPTCSVKERELN